MNAKSASAGSRSGSRPLVAVIGDLKSFENYRWHSAADQYVAALADVAEVNPLVVPALGGRLDLDGLIARVDGLLCTGSKSNVHPSRFGAAPSPAFEPYDEDRDATSLPLILKAIDAGLPLFCVCRGMQELNVALGGTLATEIQERDGAMDHRAPVSDEQRERFAIRHEVLLEGGGCLGRILDGPAVEVNSLHRQAVARLADRLAVEAVAPDGTIEAVSVRGASGYAVGVQWHPEYWAASDRPSRLLFEAFGDAARAWTRGELAPLSRAA